MWLSLKNKYRGLEINTQFKTLAFGDVSIFTICNKHLYKNGVMVPLLGGYKLFKFDLPYIEGNLEKANDFFEFIKELALKKVTYSVTETSLQYLP